jgi:transcriptional regulator with XRE-family HTH domain
MAAAIEQRRLELGLTPGQFADAAGITRQGLDPIRRGVRKAYQDKVKLGVARALRWPPDAVDRLLAGETHIDPLPSEGISEDRMRGYEERFSQQERDLAELREQVSMLLARTAALADLLADRLPDEDRRCLH